ncbi:MAG: NADH:flavin oxidoreductase [Hydrogenophilaceae bacterium]|jgi:2,4-dienoyl-CoA reductase-like NADH-dependent reductase (Old Yellow Enzyme family)|nr:NADH:flavin oxidoreductase [Hydrogenophilaceae bacterium]
MTTLFDPLPLAHGPAMKNRFMLAPLTNWQSHPDGVLSDEEFRWLVKRAEGGFGLTMTCAASVSAGGVGFPGQLGVHDDKHIDGLARLAAAINGFGSHSVVQLHHAGMRSPKDIIGQAPVCPSDNEETGARALSLDEVAQVKADFIAAAVRADRAGFHGVELHGAHGYLLCQFLSAEINKREDAYGGAIENRARLLFEIIDGVRAECRADFSLGVRLSPERFGLKLDEIKWVAARLLREAKIDYLDMSLWDVFKPPAEEEHQEKSLLAHFADLPRGDVRLGAAGKIMTGEAAARALDGGLDFVVIGRGAILHHDFPRRVAADPAFVHTPLPVSADYLRSEALSEKFVGYMRTWKGFVEEPEAA